MNALFDFFSPEAGQRRRAALDEFGRDIGYYIPPELRGILGLVAEATPTATIDRASAASMRAADPTRTASQRIGDVGNMLSEVAGVVAPAAVANRAAMPTAQALQEGLLGFSVGAQDAGRAIVDRLNQPGPVPTMYSNPIMGAVNNSLETPAQTIARLLREGRADEVTDEMMAAADPQEMARLYASGATGMDLPMDEASRMARARQMGFDVDTPLYHGTAVDFPAFDRASRGNATSALSARRATWMADNPDVASGYATFAEGGPVQRLIDASNRAEMDGDYDLADELMRQAEQLEASATEGAGGNILPLAARRDRLSFDAEGEKYDASDYVLMDKVSEAQNSGRSGVQINNFVDNADYSDWTDASHVGIFNPRDIRSRFARFDPRLSHLANLSAGIGGLGLLGYTAMQPEQEQN